MKSLFAITLVCLISSCSSWKKPLSPPPVVLVDEKPKPLSEFQKEQLRHPETLKKYAIGRYVDPSNGLVMHEAHDVYRVEATSKWNRQPLRAATRIDDPNPRSISSQYQSEVAQLRRNLHQERANSSAAMKASEQMRAQIEPLTQAVSKATDLAKQNAILRKQLRAAGQTVPASPIPSTQSEEAASDEDSVKERLRGLFKPNTDNK